MSDEIQKQAQYLSLLHPMNIYPTTVGGIALLYNVVEVSIVASALGGAALCVGIGATIFNRFVNTNTFYEMASKQHHAKQQRMHEERVDYLKNKLSELGQHAAMEQLGSLEVKINTFNETLNKRFNGGGLTFSRFSSIGDSIYSNALKAYEEIILIQRQATQINHTKIATELRELKKSNPASPKIKELESRLNIKLDLRSRTENMLMSNEQAITKLDLTMSQFGDITTETEINWAMQELQSLSKALNANNNGEYS